VLLPIKYAAALVQISSPTPTTAALAERSVLQESARMVSARPSAATAKCVEISRLAELGVPATLPQTAPDSVHMMNHAVASLAAMSTQIVAGVPSVPSTVAAASMSVFHRAAVA
jgi:hypothetical protein